MLRQFDEAARETAQQLGPACSAGVMAILDQPYGTGDRARLDVFHPAGPAQARLTVVWIHGGGWLSGSKD